MIMTGEEVACLEPEELLSITGDTAKGHVRALKLHHNLEETLSPTKPRTLWIFSGLPGFRV